MIGHIKSGQYLKDIARAILKKYCPPHKARGIHDFILATKSSVWIIINYIGQQACNKFVTMHTVPTYMYMHTYCLTLRSCVINGFKKFASVVQCLKQRRLKINFILA